MSKTKSNIDIIQAYEKLNSPLTKRKWNSVLHLTIQWGNQNRNLISIRMRTFLCNSGRPNEQNRYKCDFEMDCFDKLYVEPDEVDENLIVYEHTYNKKALDTLVSSISDCQLYMPFLKRRMFQPMFWRDGEQVVLYLYAQKNEAENCVRDVYARICEMARAEEI